jgi:hypothetical protein
MIDIDGPGFGAECTQKMTISPSAKVR